MMKNVKKDIGQEYSPLAVFIGLAMVLVGAVYYFNNEVWNWYNTALVAVGGVSLLAGLALNAGKIAAAFRGRSGRAGTNLGVLVVAVLAILVAVNYLGYRYHKRFDLTAEGLYTLSDQTKKVLAGLQKEVKVIRFDKSDDQVLSDQMSEFRSVTRQISYQRIDPQQKPDLARKYNVTRMGETIIAAGERIERPTATSESDLVNAIVKVTRDQLKNVCFVEGHGEKDRAGQEEEGYGTVDKALQNENYQTRSINLVSENQVPADCSVVVIAGPKKALLGPEAALISKFLEAGGKVLLMIDPETDPGVGELLQAWNISIGNDTVIDASGFGRLFGTGPAVPMVGSYGAHPITKDMGRTASFFPFARSVKPADSSKSDPAIVELLKTSEASWGETKITGGEARFDDGADLKGPVTLGVTATKSIGDKEARLVVIGDSDFAGNNYVRLAGNGDLFLNTVNWLAQEEDLISIRPKSPTNRSVTMTESQQRSFFLLIVIFMPLAVLGAGAYVWWKRR